MLYLDTKSQLQKSENGFLLFNGIFEKYDLSQYHLGINIKSYLSNLLVKNSKNPNSRTFAIGSNILIYSMIKVLN